MYLSDKPRAINFYKLGGREMMIEVESNGGLPPQQQQLILAENSGEDPEVKAPKKRAETWVQEETRTLIGLRREMDRLFNTSKSNKHLWEQISMKMRDKGFDRSPTMCTDKWRNLLKEYKKAKHQYKSGGTVKLPYYKEIDELLKCRSKHAGYKNPIVSKVDSFLQFSDKGIEDVSVPYSSLEGDNHGSYGGRVILVKYGECTKKIGIDGSSEAIKEAIKSAFCLRTRRAFWLEDEEDVVRCLDRDMPLGSYILHLDEGVTIKMCFYEDSERMSLRTEDKTMYAEEDLHEFLARHGWTSLRELSGFRTVDTLDALRSGAMYQGVRSLGECRAPKKVKNIF
ncbi:hypothetical protein HPP92_008753 [Vanilla planifolia]|uniref:Myb-like domain-containing protein n=1 Tax=Vanilla planifolia TaxID=51239 RepID=A0A835RA80_VANPL|nr:hypothetical protein HPP92_008753 [Vanilla planifolia]